MSKTKTITVTLTLAEAQSLEAQLRDIEQSNDEDFCEPIPCVQRERERLESARVRLTKAIMRRK